MRGIQGQGKIKMEGIFTPVSAPVIRLLEMLVVMLVGYSQVEVSVLAHLYQKRRGQQHVGRATSKLTITSKTVLVLWVSPVCSKEAF